MRTLVLCIGNTSLFGGVFSGRRLMVRFRAPVREAATARGFTRHVPARARGRIGQAVFCSVVPSLTPKVSRLVQRTFGVAPRLLTTDSPHGLAIGYDRPKELGTDRLAAALGARALFPGQNVIVVDCGTTTTVTALRGDGTLLGGAILPGLPLWPSMLSTSTAQLPLVRWRRPRTALGRSPHEAIESGIYFGQGGAVRELVQRIRAEAFGRVRTVIVGTGGNASRLRPQNLFAIHSPELILIGLNAFAQMTSLHD
ncbi:MAG: type III pantothenate kinase [Opitutaceae bacterium]|nr:type III pantothenate kinase [Opitutaceae bacterium]